MPLIDVFSTKGFICLSESRFRGQRCAGDFDSEDNLSVLYLGIDVHCYELIALRSKWELELCRIKHFLIDKC
ncbi:hypothetical protein Lal_00028987 [Lupinus albus]|nr:hypothetical protein Lal_00028987 [Lupinus albus]